VTFHDLVNFRPPRIKRLLTELLLQFLRRYALNFAPLSIENSLFIKLAAWLLLHYCDRFIKMKVFQNCTDIASITASSNYLWLRQIIKAAHYFYRLYQVPKYQLLTHCFILQINSHQGSCDWFISRMLFAFEMHSQFYEFRHRIFADVSYFNFWRRFISLHSSILP
jgi:hypothetical protein